MRPIAEQNAWLDRHLPYKGLFIGQSSNRLKPSSFYRGDLWRAGLIAARLLPWRILERTTTTLALGYYSQNAVRREIVINNLLPAVEFNRGTAEKKCRSLFEQFGLKLADLWRYEAGCKMQEAIFPPGCWEQLESARAEGRGVLLITPHIGNWEFGAPFLRKRGIPIQVITQAEPQDSFTDLRKASRARWGIETLVIGENPFAFVEVIRRLESGATVALLIDRPPPPSSVSVRLFGQDFDASIAPAELARATGCALLPACLPRTREGYFIELLPQVEYDRAVLRTRAARTELTQDLITRFQPLIARYSEQWFHFVPVWRNGLDRQFVTKGATDNPTGRIAASPR